MDNRKQHSDYILSLLVFVLIAFGLIMIYSVSKYYSLDITDGATDKFYLKKQLLWLIAGIASWIVFQSIDYRYWLKNVKYMPIITFGLLFLPIILKPFGIVSAGRWVNLGFTSFQPAEIAKLSLLFYLAGWFATKGTDLSEIKKLFWPFIAVTGFIAFLMLLQKDLGTLSIMVVIASSVIIIAGAPVYQLFSGVGLAGALLWLSVKIEPYRMERLMTFLNPESNSLSTGYHIRNALIAAGSGGLWGLGFGQSKQKYLYLPEAHTDSIFAIICEELGMLRSSLIVLLFVFVAIRGFKIAKNAPDNFSKYLATGITLWIFVQAMINIAAMFSIVPLTGVPLPFISYGGTSLLVLLSAVGVLNNITKQQRS